MFLVAIGRPPVVTAGDSILLTIRKMLGGSADYDVFDVDLCTLINSSIMKLYQMGIGEIGFSVDGEAQTWRDYLGDDFEKLRSVVDFIYTEVRMKFDPPSNSFVMNAMKDNLKELEWRLIVQVESCMDLNSGDSS